MHGNLGKVRPEKHDLELEIFTSFCNQIENSVENIAKEFDLPKHKVDAVIDRILKTGFVIVESGMNDKTINF